jgi:hypothetical protein
MLKTLNKTLILGIFWLLFKYILQEELIHLLLIKLSQIIMIFGINSM